MEKLKLKTNQEVIYWDGDTILDKTSVIETSKGNGTAKLANGITLQRESTKSGYFKRAGIRSGSKAWVADGDNEGVRMYNAYLSKNKVKKLLPILSKAIDHKSIYLDTDQAWLNEMYKTLKEFLEL